MLWGGQVALQQPAQMDPDTRALHALNAKIANDQRVVRALLPFADGLNVVLKL